MKNKFVRGKWPKRLAQEEDAIWAAMDNKTDEWKLERCQNENADSARHTKEYAASLNKQIEDSERKRLNESCVDRIEESFRQEYQKIKDEEQQLREVEANREREIRAKELVEQLEANRLEKERKKKEEMLFDRILIEEDRKRAEKEQLAVVDNRAQLRCELSIFRESLKQYNDSLAAHEKDMEVIIEEFKREHELKQLAVKQRSAKARKDLLGSCLESRKQQVADQYALKQKMKDQDRDEAEYVRFRQAQSDALDVTKKQREFQESQEAFKVLQECEKYEVVKRNRERLEMREFNDERLKENEEIDKRTNELLSRPVKTLGTGMHPFLGPLLTAENIPQGGR
uniref:Trichohyalin-plectin-homology domain-containing protein n=1 Tax=Lygus hesperus TaxID=30085 RepID=A0A0A9XM60_LYGHE